MKVFLEPTGLHSRAMTRVAQALRETLPADWVEVKRPEQADVQFLHVIDWDESFMAWDRPYVAIQYCLLTTQQPWPHAWIPFWSKALAVWSYYDLEDIYSSSPQPTHSKWGTSFPDRPRFIHAPLGVDRVFHHEQPSCRRDLIITSGYVTGRSAEAIEEVWSAAEEVGIGGIHIGPPRLEGQTRELPAGWSTKTGLRDVDLAALYHRAMYVSGLRYVEGLELPAAEGLVCGARPILFNQPSQQLWYGDAAIYIPEYADWEHEMVTARLVDAFSQPYYPVTSVERDRAMHTFNWPSICRTVWNKVTYACSLRG